MSKRVPADAVILRKKNNKRLKLKKPKLRVKSKKKFKSESKLKKQGLDTLLKKEKLVVK